VVEEQVQISVAFVGFPSANKGWPVFCELVEQLEGDSRYTFYQFAAAGAATLPNVTFVTTEVTGGDRKATTRLLNKHCIDLVVMLSPWPETFSFVAHEALAAGALIVCLANSGNVAALVRATGCGVVLENGDAAMEFFTSGDAAGFVESHRPQGQHAMLDVGTTATINGIVSDGARA
jgi:glycosyltransferase involved in cell wall biosynthesis